jgi:ABC-type dipeptide/oligopeptide/nickel transport system permease subunit
MTDRARDTHAARWVPKGYQAGVLPRMARLLTRHPSLAVGGALILVFVLSALLAPLAPHRPDKVNFSRAWEAPSAEHWLGTDNQGRDLFSRILHGARISFLVAVGSQSIVLLLGVSLGAVAGYFAGWAGGLIVRAVDVMLAFPSLLFMILLMAVLGSGTGSMVLAIGMTRWAYLARIVRGSFLSLRETQFVEAARSLGISDARIMFAHILPNALSPIVVTVTLGIPFAIIAEAGLSFVGIGVNPPTPSWGVLLSRGFGSFRGHPHLIVFPALVLSITTLGFVLVGNALRDLLDPRFRGL